MTTQNRPVPSLLEERDELPRTLQPRGWPRPTGYANGMSAKGRVIVTGGMIGWDVMENFLDGFVAQVRLALLNIRAVLAEGGAGPEHIVRLTWYVVDMDEYRDAAANSAAPIAKRSARTIRRWRWSASGAVRAQGARRDRSDGGGAVALSLRRRPRSRGRT